MFNSKQKSLISTVNEKQPKTSAFVTTAMKKAAVTKSGNGAKKYSTTGDAFVDQFANLGTYKAPRSFQEIEKDSELLWAVNPLLSVMFIFYIRMITRVVTLFTGVSTKVAQKGAELKHEGIFRMIWLSVKAPETFKKNLPLFISVGSWKDIITMLQYDLVWNGWKGKVLDWEYFGNLILSGLDNENQVNLLKKYLPQIKSNSNCKTIESQADNLISKWICYLLFGNKEEESGSTYKQYRKLKSSGTAHEWQKLISQKKFDKIDFSKIHGRALNLLVRSKFLVNQGLKDKYEKWITKPETKEVKYTGYVHELFSKLPSNLSSLDKGQQETINKQFDTLVDKVDKEKNNSGLIVVRDTSASMTSTAKGTNMSSNDIAKALALYFSRFLKGPFQNNWIEFDDRTTMREWKGKTVLEQWYNDRSNAYGSTNFQGVIKLFADMLKKGVKEEDFPTGILCISDGEFNRSGNTTNFKQAFKTLKDAGFSKKYRDNFKIILWDIPNTFYGSNSEVKFETFGDVKNCFYMSGYSASQVSFLMSGEVTTAKDLFLKAMDQEVLQMIEL